jgi:serine/threonine-protein kinase
VRARTDAGEATRLRGEQSEELLDLRMACLDRRREDLRALVDVLAQADGEVVSNAVGAARALEPPSSCAAALVGGRAQPTAAQREPVAALERRLAEARALSSAGKFEAALARARPLADEARTLGYRPLIAEAVFALAGAEHDVGHDALAEPLLHEAAATAERARDDRRAAHAWDLLAWVTASQGRRAEARTWIEYAAAAVEAAGGDVELEAENHYTLGVLDMDDARYDEALAELERASAQLERSSGADDPRLARDWNALATVLSHMARLDEAIAYYERARALLERTVGAHHPDVVYPIMNVGVMRYFQARFDEAVVPLRRALALSEAVVGAAHPMTAVARFNLALAVREQGGAAEALALATRARTDAEAAVGRDNPMLSYPLVVEGNALVDLGRPREAEALLERALVIAEAHSDDVKQLAEVRLALGRAIAAGRREAERARRLIESARTELARAPQTPLQKRHAEQAAALLAK